MVQAVAQGQQRQRRRFRIEQCFQGRDMALHFGKAFRREILAAPIVLMECRARTQAARQRPSSNGTRGKIPTPFASAAGNNSCSGVCSKML